MSELPERMEPRRTIDTGESAFVGTREDLSGVFDYVLRDVTAGGVGFSIGDEVALVEGERVNFHLPFRINDRFQDLGEVRWRRRSEGRWECGASLEGRIPLYYPVYIEIADGHMAFGSGDAKRQRLDDVLHLLVKDAWLLKRGVGVYFDHLVPYFRRLSGGLADAEFTDGLRAEIAENVTRLASLREAIERPEFREWAEGWDLTEFRRAVQPELRPEEFYERFQTSAVLPYLQSIQRLEYRLYMNFNSAVLLSQERDRRQAEFRSRQAD